MALPHSPQNLLLGGLGVPQAGQLTATRLPQCLQNLALDNAAVWQCGQLMATPVFNVGGMGADKGRCYLITQKNKVLSSRRKYMGRVMAPVSGSERNLFPKGSNGVAALRTGQPG
jgi:hypothetical protein